MSNFQKIAVVCLISLSGCAIKGNNTVIEPLDGDRARIRVSIPDSYNTYKGVRAYPSSACFGKSVAGNGTVVNPTGLAGGFEKSLNGKSLGMPADNSIKDAKFVAAEFFAKANQPISFTYHRAGEPKTSIVGMNGARIVTSYYPGCNLSINLLPVTNLDYHIVFDEADKCNYTAVQLDSTSALVKSTPIQTALAKECEE